MSVIQGKYGRKIRYQSITSWRNHAVNDAWDAGDFSDFFLPYFRTIFYFREFKSNSNVKKAISIHFLIFFWFFEIFSNFPIFRQIFYTIFPPPKTHMFPHGSPIVKKSDFYCRPPKTYFWFVPNLHAKIQWLKNANFLNNYLFWHYHDWKVTI